jgi:predicted Zn-ribbon and HTH transcriptional regulator
MTVKLFAAFASALAALFIAAATSYSSLSQKVATLDAQKPTRDEVRQIVEDKTGARLDEVLRRQEHMDKQLDRLGEVIMRLAPAPERR